jgi:hypothetical protein
VVAEDAADAGAAEDAEAAGDAEVAVADSDTTEAAVYRGELAASASLTICLR